MISDFLIRIAADGKSFFPTIDSMNRETKRLTSAVSGLQNAFTAIGAGAAAIGITTALRYMDQLINKADQIKDRAKALGVDTTTTQQVENLFGAEKGQMALEKVIEAQEKILTGQDKDGSLANSMASFGVSLDDIRSKNPTQLFNQLADAIGRVAINGERLLALKDIFGKSGGTLIEGFQKGLNSPNANKDILSDDQIAELSRAKDRQGAGIGGLLKDGAGMLATDMMAGMEGRSGKTGLGNFLQGLTLQNVGGMGWGPLLNKIVSSVRPEGFEMDPSVAAGIDKLNAREREKARQNLSTADRLIPVFSTKEEEERKRAEKLADRKTKFDIDSDSLMRIGLFRGGGGGETIQRQQLDQLKNIKGELSDIKGLFAKD